MLDRLWPRGNDKLAQCLALFSLAIISRYWHLVGRSVDYYGDSYHHWLLSYLTAQDRYAYVEFQSAEHALTNVWLPLYHYLGALMMNLSGNYYIVTLHAINIVLGAFTCVLTAYLTQRASGRKWLGFLAGGALAIQPWYVDINTLALTETLATTLLLLAIYAFLAGHGLWFSFFISLGMLTRYDLWFFAAIFLFLGLMGRRWSRRVITIQASLMFLIASGWSLWTYLQTGDPLGWYGLERSMIGWDIKYFYGHSQWNLSQFWKLEQLEAASGGLTFSLALVGSLFLILKEKGAARILAFLYVAYFALVNLQVVSGASLPEPKYLSDAFPLGIAVSIIALAKLPSRRAGILRLTKGTLLILIVLLPLNQTWITFPAWPPLGVFAFKTYVVEPERDAGFWIRDNYRGGRILCDSPTTIYYSYPKVPVGSYISSDHLYWYTNSNWSKPLLTRWIEENEVRFLVWQNASFSATWWMFPELGDRGVHVIGPLTFQLVHDGTRVYKDKTIVVLIYAILPTPAVH